VRELLKTIKYAGKHLIEKSTQRDWEFRRAWIEHTYGAAKVSLDPSFQLYDTRTNEPLVAFINEHINKTNKKWEDHLNQLERLHMLYIRLFQKFHEENGNETQCNFSLFIFPDSSSLSP